MPKAKSKTALDAMGMPKAKSSKALDTLINKVCRCIHSCVYV